MRKKLSILLGMLLICFQFASAQTIEVSGKITDDNGYPITNASVTEKGTKRGTSTDANGYFKMSAKRNATIEITSVGYQTTSIAVGSGGNFDIKLKQVNQSLSEVVVTALGIKKSQKSIGYSTQNVNASELTQANNANTLGALSGKVSGLQVISSSGTPGAASYIRLRGITSLQGGQPLIVLDGVPIDNSTFGSSLGNVAQSNRALDINPDDIESVNILKGPAAASLYGTDGSDGVLIITTKKGRKGTGGSKFDISYSYGLTFDQINKLPELQTKFIKGSNGSIGSYTSSSSLSWGAKADTLKWTGIANQWDPHGDIVGASNPNGKIAFMPYDNEKAFFQTGVTQTHSVSVGTSNDLSGFRLSYSNLNQSGIVPLSTFARNTISANADTKVGTNLKIEAAINYTNSGGQRVQEGSNISGIMLGMLRTPISFDNSYGQSDPTSLSAYQLSDGTQRSYRGAGYYGKSAAWYDNPFWTINKNKFNDEVNRLFGNVNITYMPFKWLSVSDRLGRDEYTDSRKQNFALHSASNPSGQVISNIYQFRQLINNLIATINHQFTDKLGSALVLGNTVTSRKNLHNNATGTGLTIPDFYNFSNTSAQTTTETYSLLRTKAFFAQAKFDYNDYLFLELSERAENSSAFVSGVRTKGKWFLFPSVSGSFIFSDAFKLKNNFFNYGKVRVSYGEAGRLPDVYSTKVYYASSSVGDGWTSGLTYPINGQQGFFAGTLANPNILPERTNTLDLGIELKLFNNRVGVNATYYNSHSKNLLANVPTPPSSGYGQRYTNAGEIENKGIEIQATVQPVRKESFSWNMAFNWSMNRNKVITLGEGIEQLFLGGFTNGSINAVAGKPFGMIYGIGYYRDSKGNLVIDDGSGGGTPGYPILNSSSIVLGNPNPSWIGGVQNNFIYKNFNLSILFDTRFKFDMWDGTRGALVNFGRAKETETRGQTFTFSGVTGHLDADGKLVTNGVANKLSVPLDQSWYTGGGSGFTVNEPFIEDATFTKLREVTLGYNFDLSKTKVGKIAKSAVVNVVGRNLFLFTKYKGVDPETSLAGPDALGIDYFNTPSTRTYGFNIKLNF